VAPFPASWQWWSIVSALYSGASAKRKPGRTCLRPIDLPHRLDDQGSDVGRGDDDGATTCRGVPALVDAGTPSYDAKAETYETQPNTKPITIRQLLTHTSGISQLVRPGSRRRPAQDQRWQ
jgi:hypothetical protein